MTGSRPPTLSVLVARYFWLLFSSSTISPVLERSPTRSDELSPMEDRRTLSRIRSPDGSGSHEGAASCLITTRTLSNSEVAQVLEVPELHVEAQVLPTSQALMLQPRRLDPPTASHDSGTATRGSLRRSNPDPWCAGANSASPRRPGTAKGANRHPGGSAIVPKPAKPPAKLPKSRRNLPAWRPPPCHPPPPPSLCLQISALTPRRARAQVSPRSSRSARHHQRAVCAQRLEPRRLPASSRAHASSRTSARAPSLLELMRRAARRASQVRRGQHAAAAPPPSPLPTPSSPLSSPSPPPSRHHRRRHTVATVSTTAPPTAPPTDRRPRRRTRR